MAMQGTESAPIRFPFELSPESGELRKNGIRLKLTGQAIDVLILLLENPGRVVAREELQQKLWPGASFGDFDHGLNAAINRLREVLADSATEPKFVETVPRRGYRFIGQIALQAFPERSTAVAHGQENGKRLLRRRWLFLLSAGLLIAFCTGFYAFVLNRRAGKPPIKSLAVLPLKNLSGDATQEYLVDGITESLIGQLSGIHELRVISRTSVMRFKDTQLLTPQIAKMLNVDAIVEGAVIREGSRIRVSAQLIRAVTDEHLWSGVYDRELKDVFTLDSEVTQAIADQIRIRLTPQQQARLRSATEVNPGAYDAYLRGRFFETNPTFEANRTAVSYFQEAINKDPGFAPAYGGLADCYLDSGAYRWVPPKEAYTLAREAINTGMRLDETRSEIHSALGYLYWQYDWNWSAAEKEFRNALALNSSDVDARESLIWFLGWSGRRAEALAELQTIRNDDPAYPIAYFDESGIYYHERDYKELMEASHKAVEIDPNEWSGHYFLAVAEDGLGRPTQAVPEYQKAVELSHNNTDALAGLAHAYLNTGAKAQAAKILRQLKQQSTQIYVSPYMIATIYASMGDKNKAFEFLEAAFRERSPDIAYFLKADLRLDLLRTDLRYSDLVRRVGFPQ